MPPHLLMAHKGSRCNSCYISTWAGPDPKAFGPIGAQKGTKVAVNDIWRLSIKGTVHGQDHVVTCHFRNVSDVGTDAAVGQAIIDAWQADARAQYRACFRNEDTPVDLITAQKVCGSVPLPAAIQETEVAPNRVGSAGSASDLVSAPASTARIITLRTAIAGRRYRGRQYLGGVVDGNTDTPHLLNSGHVATLQAYGDALVAAGGVTYNLFVFSRVLAALGGQCQDFGADVTQAVARNYLGTMRSRMLGHGN